MASGVYKVEGKKGVSYGIDYVHPLTGKRVRKILKGVHTVTMAEKILNVEMTDAWRERMVKDYGPDKLRDEIMDAENRLANLKSEHDSAMRSANSGIEKLKSLARSYQKTIEANANAEPTPLKYPDPPKPSILVSKDGDDLPKRSGVYFLWEDGEVVYVGRSDDLSSRLRFGRHQALRLSDMVSVLPFERERCAFAEAYYIGLLRPKRNFPCSKGGVNHGDPARVPGVPSEGDREEKTVSMR